MIKVADLLHTSWTTDTLQLVDKFSTRFPHRLQNWISAKVFTTWLNDTDIHLNAEKVSASYYYTCDRCAEEYIKSLVVRDEEITASTEKTWDETLVIDKKNERIDLEEWITNLLITKLPIKNLCKKCEEQWLDQIVDETEYTTIIRK